MYDMYLLPNTKQCLKEWLEKAYSKCNTEKISKKGHMCCKDSKLSRFKAKPRIQAQIQLKEEQGLQLNFMSAILLMLIESGPDYTDTFSNRSVFILLHFQIDSLWIAYSNVCVFIVSM